MKTFLRYNKFILLLLLIGSCQKDDICPPGSETTPGLVIELYDSDDPSELEAVENLMILAVNKEDTLLGPVTVNNVKIPLRTAENSTSYRFILNAGGDNPNEDVVKFFYSPSTDYINRACGYKVDFLDLRIERVEDEANWIKRVTIKINKVENDTTAHVYFFH